MDAESRKIIEKLKPVKGKLSRGWKKGVPRSKITKALIATNSVVKDIEDTFNKMSDRDRSIYVSLATGEDELTALLKVGWTHGLHRIAKIVYTKELKPLRTNKITLKNYKDLDEPSYQRMLRIAQSEVKTNLLAKTDYHSLIADITGLFKLLAPDQVAVLAQASQDKGAKWSDRIKAAEAILDRANYGGAEMKKKEVISNPVQVNIIIGGKPKAEFNPILEARQIEIEEDSNVL